MSKLLSLFLLSTTITACAVEDEPVIDEAALDEDITAEDTSEHSPLFFSGRRCVDVSAASAQRVSCELIPFCSNPNWNSSLSRHHPVAWNQNCGGDYVKVRSLWTGLCYIVRKGALGGC